MGKIKDAYYFSHDSNASGDEKLIWLENKYGYAAYAWFFKILEKMRDSSTFTLPVDTMMLKKLLGLNNERDDPHFLEFMNDCFTIHAFFICEDDTKRFYSDSFMERMSQITTKHKVLAKAGKMGAEKRWGNKREATQLHIHEQ